ncbi:MAG TPA: DUF3047 domain-containing protein [Nevskiaceae bacterium]|nr:DUF3047 domain-containing protein [Nevskiaceae bacterium]
MSGARLWICTALVLCLWTATAHAGSGEPPAFSVTGLAGWVIHGFMHRPQTKYQLVDVDGRQVVHAVCRDSAAGLVWKGKVDLAKTPWLHWRWKVARVYPGLDERRKAGDDFPARVYVVIGSRWLPWSLRTLSYAWANDAQEPAWWDSPYSNHARIVPVEHGPQYVGQWRTEARNVRADFKRVFGKDVEDIHAVAVMSDCDDSHNHGQAWYGDLHFAAH